MPLDEARPPCRPGRLTSQPPPSVTEHAYSAPASLCRGLGQPGLASACAQLVSPTSCPPPMPVCRQEGGTPSRQPLPPLFFARVHPAAATCCLARQAVFCRMPAVPGCLSEFPSPSENVCPAPRFGCALPAGLIASFRGRPPAMEARQVTNRILGQISGEAQKKETPRKRPAAAPRRARSKEAWKRGARDRRQSS
jgi:hypothetical protein